MSIHPFNVELPRHGVAVLVERRPCDPFAAYRGADLLDARCEKSGRVFTHPDRVPARTPTARVEWVWCFVCTAEHKLIMPDALREVRPRHPRAEPRDKS